VLDSTLRPSSDTPTHLELYRAFRCGGIVHTHSEAATTLAQARTPLRCMGTTHADYFRGDVPVTRPLRQAEVASEYERNTGLVIVETFATAALSPDEVTAVLVANHGPFVWGSDPFAAVERAQMLELLARMMDDNARLSEPLDSIEVTREAVIRSALESARQAEAWGLGAERIVISCKMSQVQDLIAVYRALGERCEYALHLGLTEAGMGSKGIVASTAAMAVLLQEGIGDTIRVSLTPEPGGERTREVQVAQEILQTMGLRAFTPMVSACPGCGRTTSTVFQELADRIQTFLRTQMPIWRESYPGVEEMRVAVMGCVVNGPGESKHADIGISLPGTNEVPVAPVYVDGKKTVTLKGERIAEEFQAIVENYVKDRFGSGQTTRRSIKLKTL